MSVYQTRIHCSKFMKWILKMMPLFDNTFLNIFSDSLWVPLFPLLFYSLSTSQLILLALLLLFVFLCLQKKKWFYHWSCGCFFSCSLKSVTVKTMLSILCQWFINLCHLFKSISQFVVLHWKVTWITLQNV